jgi:hypothetical protein
MAKCSILVQHGWTYPGRVGMANLQEEIHAGTAPVAQKIGEVTEDGASIVTMARRP